MKKGKSKVYIKDANITQAIYTRKVEFQIPEGTALCSDQQSAERKYIKL